MRYTARKPRKLDDEKLQPEKCRGCIWGRWEASKQFCSRIKCPRDGKEVKK